MDKFAAGLALVLASCVGGEPPGWTAGEVDQIEVRAPTLAVPPRILDGADLRTLVTCASKAEPMSQDAWRRATHVIDVRGHGRAAGRWLYDSRTGQLVRLTYNLAPVYKLDEGCRSDVERRLPPPNELVDPAAKPLPPKAFEAIDEKMSLGQIVHKLGPAQSQQGSGLCIFVWRVADGREFAVGTSGCDPAKPPIYAKFL